MLVLLFGRYFSGNQIWVLVFVSCKIIYTLSIQDRRLNQSTVLGCIGIKAEG
jgi:hypothetical protein